MALNTSSLILGANAIAGGITHLQLFSAAPNATGTTNAIGSRVAATPSVNGTTGAITWSNVAFSTLGANQAVAGVGYWSASTAGTFRGYTAFAGGSDTTANAAGDYTVTSITETPSAS